MELRCRERPCLGQTEYGQERRLRRNPGRTHSESVRQAAATTQGNALARGVLDPVRQGVQYLRAEGSEGGAQTRQRGSAVRLGEATRSSSMEASRESS